MEVSNKNFDLEEEGIDLKRYFFLFLKNWYWLLIGFILFLAVAWLNLRYSTNIYRVKARVYINNDESRSISEQSIIEEFGFVNNTSNISNELQVLKSTSLMEKVVDSLDLNISYLREGRIKTSEEYKNSPIKLDVDAQNLKKLYGSSYKVIIKNNQQFDLINEQNDTLKGFFGTTIIDDEIDFSLNKVGKLIKGYIYIVKVSSPERVARSYSNKLEMKIFEFTDVIEMELDDPIPAKSIDILNALVQAYNKSVIDEKNSSGRKTLSFIDERLQFVAKELYDVEEEVQNFKENRKLTIDLAEQANTYLERANTTTEQLIELKHRQDIILQLENFLQVDSNRYKSLPISSKVVENTLATLIGDYNTLLFERSQFLEGATLANPAVATFDERISFLREAIINSIKTLKVENKNKLSRIEKELKPIEDQLSAIPSNERNLRQIMRQQEIKQQLFLYLLQKREETALSIAAQVSTSRFLNKPYRSQLVSPEKLKILAFTGILGLFFPAMIIFLRDFLDNRVYSLKDIQKLTSVPFLGFISESKTKKSIVVTKGSRSSVAEMFRLLRTNLSFFDTDKEKKKQIIAVTSTISGEGKTFITINLGASLSIAGKKIILIGMDLRKPRLSEYISGKKEFVGLSNYLVGEVPLDAIINKVDGFDNFHYIGSGPIPPNPAELILSTKTSNLLNQLREEYDYILIDTAPIGLVTDALLISKNVDQSIVVARYGYTKKGLLGLIEDTYQKDKLPNFGLVLNGVKRNNSYGYDYGYGYGYYDD